MATFKGEKLPTCYASCSIGYDSSMHTLPKKLAAIAAAGFDAIELSMPDILAYGKLISSNGAEPDPKDYASLHSVGREIRQLCEQRKLKVLVLQPFANFEGWPKDSDERKDAFERARGWMWIMEAVGTDMLQVGSSDSEGISANFDQLAADLAELADMLSEKGFKIAYENWCWATHAPTWKDVWQIVQKANRPNLGLCLDTFQSAGGEWGSPVTESGLNGDGKRAELDHRWKRSCKLLSETVPPEKIFFLQISDAYRMDPPSQDKPDDSGLRSRGQWSHDYRPMPYDGGYLPIEDFTRAVLQTGFRGWFSIEVFDGKGPQKYGDDMGPYAGRTLESLRKLLQTVEDTP
ncbi:uncharacterized protein A1O9_08016 [Exophiala aquamarina CBS 119918]|uniref:Xylose isomerase-like TIM barrel domain-containing protein n=1 Tax=Exophiala aquamarina CBS 119918 TaxID=1182545 RepID=A0A072PLN0_9EURO|nr:uncharacterized protein A1O9_08016 [Exophiala aquamarina CBS 119918]KEF56435.1 hypothetical protein A1O9_08016 [Exophiala aquamarina CBS 119918]